MNKKIYINQCEFIFDEGIRTIINMGRILTEMKNSTYYNDEYKCMEKICYEKWGIESNEIDSIIKIFNKTKKEKENGTDM